MKRFVRIAFVFVALATVVFSCGKSTEGRSTAENFSSFLNDNEAIVSFGSIRLGTILQKTEYDKEAKIKAMLGPTINQLANSLKIDEPVFFAVEGPINDANPKATYLFLDVKNADSLKANLTTNGFEIEEGKHFSFLQDGDLSLAFNQTMAVAIVKADVDNPEDELANVFKQFKKDVSTGHVADILKKTDDVVVGANLSNLYGTSNTDLENLSEEKRKELRNMLTNSFVDLTVKFDAGALVIETKNYFSDALKAKLFLGSDSKGTLVNNMGKGTPFMGLSMNLDAVKAQQFLTDYAPNALKDLSKELGGEFEKAMVLADFDVSKLVTGQVGILLFGDIASALDGLTPDANLFIGLAGQGKMLGNLLKERMAKDFAVVNLSDNNLIASTSANYAGNAVELPEIGKNYGKGSVNLFIDVSTIDMKEFQLDGASQFVELIQYVQFDYDINGGKLVIKAKDGKDNILKQVFQKALTIFEDMLV